MLVQVEIAADGVQLVEETDEILQRSAETIDGPCRNHVDLALGDGMVIDALRRLIANEMPDKINAG